jgi:hypothetical protein
MTANGRVVFSGGAMARRDTHHLGGFGPAKDYRRGSRRRVRKIRFRGNWSIEIVIFILSMLLVLTVLIPWIVRHSVGDAQEHGEKGPAVHSIN